jgi:hypothetical protein
MEVILLSGNLIKLRVFFVNGKSYPKKNPGNNEKKSFEQK